MLKRFFRKLGDKHDLAVSMVGIKLGNALLQLGCGDGGLLAALAAKVGLTGRAAAVDATPEGVAAGELGAAVPVVHDVSIEDIHVALDPLQR